MKRHSYLFAAFSVEKWTQNTCMEMIRKLSGITRKPSCLDMLTMFRDGNDEYTFVLPKCYPLGLVDYGQLVKIKEKGG